MGFFSKKTVEKINIEQKTNAALDSSVRGQIAALISGGNYTGDTLHQISSDFGYPETLEFENYWHMYRRFGIAKNIVESYPSLCWMDSPIINANDAFKRETEALIKNVKLWQRLRGLDIRQRVGRYAGLFMRVRDDRHPSEPIDKLSGIGGLVQMVPLYESQLRVTETVKDVNADDYGMPKFYQFNGGETGTRNEHNRDGFNIHPSRIILSAEGADTGSIYGISSLESCYNSLMDLRKIIGAGGEGFYKNAAKDLVFELKDASTAKANSSLLDKFTENIDEWARNRSRRSIWTPGLEVKTLDSNLVDPINFFMNALFDVSAGSGIPSSVLIGNQTGKLAGDQDTDQFRSNGQARRETFLSEMVSNVLDWLILHGILPHSEYEIEWNDLRENSDAEKLALSEKMAAINEKSFRSGVGVPFSGEEIREKAGYIPEDLPDFVMDIEEVDAPGLLGVK